MKLTKGQLRRVIREELTRLMKKKPINESYMIPKGLQLDDEKGYLTFRDEYGDVEDDELMEILADIHSETGDTSLTLDSPIFPSLFNQPIVPQGSVPAILAAALDNYNVYNSVERLIGKPPYGHGLELKAPFIQFKLIGRGLGKIKVRFTTARGSSYETVVDPLEDLNLRFADNRKELLDKYIQEMVNFGIPLGMPRKGRR